MPIRRAFALLLAACAATPLLAAQVDTTIGAATPIGSLPMEFDGNTFGAPNAIAGVSGPACAGLDSLAGGEAVYTWLAGPASGGGIGTHVDVYVTPSPGFDAVVYVLTTAGDGSSCVASSDTAGAGGIEYVHMEEIVVVGQRYHVYIDSRTAAGGSYHMRASNDFIGVELQQFSID